MGKNRYESAGFCNNCQERREFCEECGRSICDCWDCGCYDNQYDSSSDWGWN